MAQFHFIGLAGTAMATLAAMLKRLGHEVQGSDHNVYPPMSDFLEREGIAVLDGYREEHITGDLQTVIVGNAISRGNPELEAVLDRKIRYRSLPEAIREHFLWQSRSIVIAGTHGKTTTTALAGWLLTAAGRDPSVLIGGVAANFGGSYRIGGGRDFVIEGDEYDSAFFDKTAKFLKYLPDIVVIGNLEYDHADIYADMEALRVAFRRLLVLVPRSGRVIVGADSEEALRLAHGAPCAAETVGLTPEADWYAAELEPAEAGVRFELTYRGDRLGHVESPLFGRHNVQNTLAAFAAAHAAGVDLAELTTGLASFQGVRRRLEVRGVVRGVTIIDDFAHHPTAILETVRAIRASYPDHRVWAVFEPRSATSCRRVFQQDFARAFVESGADEIVLAAVYRATLPDDERLSVDDLVRDLKRAGKRARHLPDVEAIVRDLAHELRDGDVVVVMSNGGFGGIHGKLIDALEASAPRGRQA
jgi:UDP-N-acetylmuramate: L-alanyl-gamma-D-glutamyl-meso-diaminopimelate ligase